MSDNIQDIEVLKANYARYADAVFRTSGSDAAATALADLFTDDAVLDLGPFGRYEGRSQLLNALEHPARHHGVEHPLHCEPDHQRRFRYGDGRLVFPDLSCTRLSGPRSGRADKRRL